MLLGFFFLFFYGYIILFQNNTSIWETCRLLAACALQHQRSSCFSCVAMCSCTTVVRGASAGEKLGRHHTAVHTQEKARGFLRRRARTPCGASCRHHMFYKSPGEGREERIMTSSDISIPAPKDTPVLKVSGGAVHTAQIKSPDLSPKLH